ncbi:MAG: thioredoxin family protein [Clostridia bacterium]|nr:thioredoxin family protein [Clostridia bacterium]
MALQKLNPDNFSEKVYENEEACLVVFSRKSCHVCQSVLPILEELAPKYEGKFPFYYVDAEEHKSLFQSFSLKGVPQILFFNEGAYQGKMAGQIDEDELEDKIAEILDEV